MINEFPEDLLSILPEDFLSKVSDFIQLLLRWNNKINLISKSTEKEIMIRHIIDSAQLIKYIDKEKEIIDVGSGAGFPGLILSYAGVKKISLIEANKKKSSFLLQASLISNNDVYIYSDRCEHILNLQGDIITARAFASVEKILNWTENLKKENTEYLLLKGKNVDIEMEEAQKFWKCSTWNIPSITDKEGSILLIKNISKKANYD